MNQTKSEFSRTIETKDNLFSFRRNIDLKKNETEMLFANEDICAILDAKAPTWNCEIVDMRNIGNMVLITAALSINGTTRHGIGTAAHCTETEILRAEKNALVCAAKKFAFIRAALDAGSAHTTNKIVAFPENPMAQSLYDLITARQISMINTASDAAGIDSETECQKLMHCGVGELSRNAAARFIEHLESVQSLQPIEAETFFLHAG